MKYLRGMLLIIIVLIAGVALADEFGTDGVGVVGEPGDDNSCFPGGAWAGTCGDDPWMWNAGWYHIRVIRGEMTYDQVPDQYKSVVPSQAEAPAPVQNTSSNDYDRDGVLNDDDDCPYVPGFGDYNGCPKKPAPVDSDSDGWFDYMDDCPNEYGTFFGCPEPSIPSDSDLDGWLDNVDACPDTYGPLNGCDDFPLPDPMADSDYDGWPDSFDPCPSTPGSYDGCTDDFPPPPPDFDFDDDGLEDWMDPCPHDSTNTCFTIYGAEAE